MASQLPFIPRILFTVLEPISLFAGCIGAIHDPDWFIGEQIWSVVPAPPPPSDNARLVALQLGNTYALVGLLGTAVMHTTSEVKVIKAWLVACLICDFTHVGMTCWVIGYQRSVDVLGWNALTWGNIGATIILGSARIAYLLGWFGPSSSSSSGSRAAATKGKKTA